MEWIELRLIKSILLLYQIASATIGFQGEEDEEEEEEEQIESCKGEEEGDVDNRSGGNRATTTTKTVPTTPFHTVLDTITG